MEIARAAYKGCEDLRSVSFPQDLRAIGDDAFNGCVGLELAELPVGVRTVGDRAFFKAGSLPYPAHPDSLWLPDGLTHIGERAFAHTGYLKIRVPASVHHIGTDAFKALPGRLTEVICPPGSFAERWCEANGQPYSCRPWHSEYQREVDANGDTWDYVVDDEGYAHIERWYVRDDLWSGDGAIAIEVPSRLGGHPVRDISAIAFPRGKILSVDPMEMWSPSSVRIPEGIGAIQPYAFYGYEWIGEIHVPDSVTSIGNWAFAACPQLKRVHLPSALSHMGDHVFHGCTSLEFVRVPEGIAAVGDGTFKGCRKLSEVILPDGIRSIGDHAFAHAGAYEEGILELPANLESIGSHAFADSQVFNDISDALVLPDGLIHIGEHAFDGCAIRCVVIPQSVSSIGEGAFEEDGDIDLVCEDGSYVQRWLEENGYSYRSVTPAFFDGKDLDRALEWEDWTVSVYADDYDRKYWARLERWHGKEATLVIPATMGGATVYLVDERCFAESPTLVEAHLPNTIEGIESEAFYGCLMLQWVFVPASVKRIADDAFTLCEDVCVVCPPGSYAQRWCEEHGVECRINRALV